MAESYEELQQENRRLKRELTAQIAVCQKLREEKEASIRTLDEAEEEIANLQEELYLREQRFLTMKEEKENEILMLKQNIRDLESQLFELPDTDLIDGEDEVEEVATTHSVKPPEIPDLSAAEIVDSLAQWEGTEDAIDLFEDLLILESDVCNWTPGSNGSFKWKTSFYLYLSSPKDTSEVVEEVTKNCLPHLQKLCAEYGSNLTLVSINDDELIYDGVQDHFTPPFCTWAVEHSDIFVGIIRNEMNTLTKLEAEVGFLNNPSSNNAFFLFLPSDDKTSMQDQKTAKFKDRIRKCSSTQIIECGYNIKSGVQDLKDSLIAKIKKLVIVKKQNEKEADTLGTLALIEDMKIESEQRCLLEQYVRESSLLEENSVVFNALDQYVMEDSPVKEACLLFGTSGSGKSTLIANWVKRWSNSAEEILVFYHFIKIIGSTSAEVCCIYRRLIQQLQHHTKDDSELPNKPKELPSFFLKMLKRVSSNTSKKVMIVVDNLDHIKNFEEYFSWMLKPLPHGVRVVATASEEDMPDNWKLLKSVNIPSFTYTDASDLVEAIHKSSKLDILTEDQIPALGIHCAYSPLWCSVLTRHVLCFLKKDMADEEVDEVLDQYDSLEGFIDLLHHILEYLHTQFPNIFPVLCMILQLLYWSRNGLSLAEIQLGNNTSTTVVLLVLYELLRRNIVRETEGLYYIHNIQIQEAIETLLCTDQSVDYMLTWTEVLVDVFSDNTGLISRQTEELLWLFKRAELKKELYYAILNVDILKQMFASYRLGELIEYWQFLHPSLNTMASQYFKQVKSIESENSEEHSPSYLVTLCTTIGKILMELGCHDEALPCLQYALELCESYSDPESIDIATILIDLGKCNFLAASYATAEGYLTEALQVYENVYSHESVCLLQILIVLEKVARKLGKNEIAEMFSTRIFSIKQTVITRDIKPHKILRSRYQELENTIAATDGLQKSKCCNESAVIIAIFGEFQYAEMRMMEAFDLLDAVNDPLLTSLHINLGNLYYKYEQFEMATVLMEKAFEMLDQPLFANKKQWINVTEKLITLYRMQGSIELAEPIQRLVVDYLKEEYTPEHLRVAKALNNLAVLYCLEKKFEKAIPVFEEAISLYKYNLGDRHETVIRACHNMKLAVENSKL